MRRISPTNPVRRRLFADTDWTEEARIDNSTNVLQELIARYENNTRSAGASASTGEKAEKSKRWNFDFENGVPLEGFIEWVKVDDDNWLGSEKDTKVCDDNDILQSKLMNEVTPNEKTTKDPPAIRKRKSDTKTSDKGPRRKISFD